MPNVIIPHQGRLPVLSARQRERPRVLMSLTGVRGVAAWWIVMYHVHDIIPVSGWERVHAFIDKGYLAVDLFFVLSGFIISMNYLAEFDTFSWRAYMRFLALRLGRIYPLHLFMMLVFLANPLAIVMMSHAQQTGERYNAVYFGLSLLLIQNWGFSNALAWNVPAWSISTEWFAYLIFPCLVMWERRAKTKLRAGAGIIASLLILTWLSRVAGDDIPTNGLLRCTLEFFAGGSIYLLWRHRSADQRYVPQIATGAGAILLGTVLTLPVPAYPVATLAWCVLIYGIADQTTFLSRILSIRLVYIIGEYSYSTYLVHYLVRDWIKFGCVGNGVAWPVELMAYVGVTALASFCLYRVVEVPGRNFVRTLVDTGWLRAPPPMRTA